MALCDCQYIYPRCEYHYCGKRADWSRWLPTWGSSDGNPGRFKFMCDGCLKIYITAMETPIKGITRPENASEDWRPSLMECIAVGTSAVVTFLAHTGKP